MLNGCKKSKNHIKEELPFLAKFNLVWYMKKPPQAHFYFQLKQKAREVSESKTVKYLKQ